MQGDGCASTTDEITQGVAESYDSSIGVWEDLWGEHIHHGFYDLHVHKDHPLSPSDHKAAQLRMIEEALSFAGVPEEEGQRPRSVLDVGCGMGGSSRYLANKYGCHVKGITISPQEVERCISLTSLAGLAHQVEFQVGDALNQPFPDGQFDLVWCLECADHVPGKEKLMSEMVRVAAPGGRIIILTWCHRDLLPGEDSLKPEEQELLDELGKVLHLLDWRSRADYVKMAQSLHVEDLKTADWSENVTATLFSMIKSSSNWKDCLLKYGPKGIEMKGMMESGSILHQKGKEQGLMMYTIISARKAT